MERGQGCAAPHRLCGEHAAPPAPRAASDPEGSHIPAERVPDPEGSHIPAQWVPGGCRPSGTADAGRGAPCPAPPPLAPLKVTPCLPALARPWQGIRLQPPKSWAETAVPPRVPSGFCIPGIPPVQQHISLLRVPGAVPGTNPSSLGRGIALLPSLLPVCLRPEAPAAWLPRAAASPAACWSPSLRRARGGHTGGANAAPCQPRTPRAQHHSAQLAYGHNTARLFSRLRTTALRPPAAQGRPGTATGSSDGHHATSTGQAARGHGDSGPDHPNNLHPHPQPPRAPSGSGNPNAPQNGCAREPAQSRTATACHDAITSLRHL